MTEPSSPVALSFLTLFAGGLAGCWASPPPVAPPIEHRASTPVAHRGPEPIVAEFGTIDDDGVLHPSAEIPLYPGSAFGWRLQLPCQHTVEVDEELRLPSAGDWSTDPDVAISARGKVATVHSEAACLDGWIESSWRVSAGDPPGIWVLRVTAAGFAPQTFRATFVPTVAPTPGPLPSGKLAPSPAPPPP
jgi:hypothetical protein